MLLWAIRFMRCLRVSTRLRRRYRLHPRQIVRPVSRNAVTASLRAVAPTLLGVQGLAVLRGGSEGLPAIGPKAAPNIGPNA